MIFLLSSLRRGIRLCGLCVLCGGGLIGCASRPVPPVTQATRPATAIDARQAQPEYWLAQPARYTVEGGDFEALWQAAERTAKDHGFRIDRRDYRLGIMTTDPLTSKQFFELWRSDEATAHDVAQSSLNTIRRTIHFEFQRREDGTFIVAPKVLVEQLANVGHRITSAVQYQSVFDPSLQRGSAEEDQGTVLPQRYWYAIGRDETMEKILAGEVGERLGRAGK